MKGNRVVFCKIRCCLRDAYMISIQISKPLNKIVWYLSSWWCSNAQDDSSSRDLYMLVSKDALTLP
jgi:hypothetical protein